MKKSEEYILVCVTASSSQEAEKLAVTLVEQRLAACGNIVPDIRSLFWWNGMIQTEQEVLLILKSRGPLFPDLVKVVKSLHSYDVPEIIAIPIIAGAEDYLCWLDNETKKDE